MSMYDSTDFASAEFARHPDGRIAARNGSGRRWYAKMPAGFWANPDNNLMAADGWVPVLECPDPEQHGPVDYKVLLEQAERERDEARASARAAFVRCWELKKARQEVVDELYSLRAATQEPTDAEVEAAARALWAMRWSTSWDEYSAGRGPASPDGTDLRAVQMRRARAALSAARAARRDEEKR